MDDHCLKSETTGLLDYVSHGNGYQSNIQRRHAREEDNVSIAEPVGRSLPSPGHNVLILVILTVSFLSALLYLVLPIGVHVCLQTECYFPKSSSSGGRNDSTPVHTNLTKSGVNGTTESPLMAPAVDAGGAQGSCDVSPFSNAMVSRLYTSSYSGLGQLCAWIAMLCDL